MNNLTLSLRLLLSLAFVAFCLPAHSANLGGEAARIEFVLGTAHVVSSTGEKREATKGMPIQVGDTVISEDARVQLRFGDGGFVALAPRSEFRVNAYSWNGAPDGTERLSMTLLKGGLRTISGMIGKAMQSAYEMATSVATIGIRGTEYTIVFGQSITGTVAEGRIAVCNGAGCLDVGVGQSYYVKDENTKPVFTTKAAELPPPAPGRPSGIVPANVATAPDHDLRLSEYRRLAVSSSAIALLESGAPNGSRDAGVLSGGGPLEDAARGVGFVLIGSTAPNVENAAQRVSNFLNQSGLGNGNGLGLGNDQGLGNGRIK
jgi:hypothetical protein